jgi:hypothetical protein
LAEYTHQSLSSGGRLFLRTFSPFIIYQIYRNVQTQNAKKPGGNPPGSMLPHSFVQAPAALGHVDAQFFFFRESIGGFAAPAPQKIEDFTKHSGFLPASGLVFGVVHPFRPGFAPAEEAPQSHKTIYK